MAIKRVVGEQVFSLPQMGGELNPIWVRRVIAALPSEVDGDADVMAGGTGDHKQMPDIVETKTLR